MNVDFDALLKTPRTRDPQSPNQAQAAIAAAGGAGATPFSSAARPAAPRTSFPAPAVPAAATVPRGDARHRVSALGHLPVTLTAALRQRELQPQAEPCTFGCGAAGVVWAALGGTLYVWRASAPQGCRRLASPLPSELAAADLVCEVQPGACAGDEVLLLVCWASRTSGRLALYHLQALSQPPPLASPPPISEAIVPLACPIHPEAPLALRATPGTVPHAAGPTAAAVLATTASTLIVANLDPQGGGPADFRVSVHVLQRSGKLASIVTSATSIVGSYFGAAPRSDAPAIPISRISLGADLLLALAAPSSAAAPAEPAAIAAAAVAAPPPPSATHPSPRSKSGGGAALDSHTPSWRPRRCSRYWHRTSSLPLYLSTWRWCQRMEMAPIPTASRTFWSRAARRTVQARWT